MASVIRGSGASTLGGNVDVQGVLTYEDVTSVDSVGIVTARSGIVIDTQDTSANSLSIGSKGGGANDGHLTEEGPKINFLATRSQDGATGSAAYIQQKAIGNLVSSFPVDLAFGVRRFGSSFEAMRIVSTGRVGIGTSVPDELLEVGNGTVSGALKVSGQSSSVTSDGFTIDWESSTNSTRLFSEPSDSGSSQYKIYTTNSGTRAEALRITSAGQLQATGAADVRLTLGSGGTAGTNDSVHVRADGANLLFMNASGGLTKFERNGTETLTLTSVGQIQHQASGGDNQFISKRTDVAGSNGNYFFHLRARNNTPVDVGSLGFHRDTATDDSRFVISTRNTGGSNTERLRITSDGQFETNGVRNIYQSFSLVNNTTYDWDFTVPDEGSAGNSFYLVAGYNHYYTTNYGAHRTVWFSARGTSVNSMGNGIEQYNSLSGAWTFSKPNATTVRITKTSGSYGGSGYGFFHLMYNHF